MNQTIHYSGVLRRLLNGSIVKRDKLRVVAVKNNIRLGRYKHELEANVKAFAKQHLHVTEQSVRSHSTVQKVRPIVGYKVQIGGPNYAVDGKTLTKYN